MAPCLEVARKTQQHLSVPSVFLWRLVLVSCAGVAASVRVLGTLLISTAGLHDISSSRRSYLELANGRGSISELIRPGSGRKPRHGDGLDAHLQSSISKIVCACLCFVNGLLPLPHSWDPSSVAKQLSPEPSSSQRECPGQKGTRAWPAEPRARVRPATVSTLHPGTCSASESLLLFLARVPFWVLHEVQLILPHLICKYFLVFQASLFLKGDSKRSFRYLTHLACSLCVAYR